MHNVLWKKLITHTKKLLNIQKEKIDGLNKEMKSSMNDDSLIDYSITKNEYAYNVMVSINQ